MSAGRKRAKRDQVAAELADLKLLLHLAALFLGEALGLEALVALGLLVRELLVYLASAVDVELHLLDLGQRLGGPSRGVNLAGIRHHLGNRAGMEGGELVLLLTAGAPAHTTSGLRGKPAGNKGRHMQRKPLGNKQRDLLLKLLLDTRRPSSSGMLALGFAHERKRLGLRERALGDRVHPTDTNSAAERTGLALKQRSSLAFFSSASFLAWSCAS